MSRILLILIFSFAFSLSSQAKEYAVAFTKDNFKKFNSNQKSFARTGVVTQRVLKNLELIIVEGTDDSVESLRQNPDVDFVDHLRVIEAPKKRFSLPFETFNQNAEIDTPWGILAVEAPITWLETDGARGIKVLVLDTGIDKDHPNIASRFVEGRNLISFGGSDDLPYPYFDEQGHGTHVAGTILADGGTGGVVGVAPNASLYSGKVCNNGCPGSAILAGVDWAIEAKMDVVNMSLGGAFGSPTAQRAYQKAEDNNVVIIAASGNDGRGSVGFPAGYPSVLSVGAISENLEIAPFSNWGSNLDVVAPGVDVLSSFPQGTGREAITSVNFVEGEEEALNALSIDGSTVGEAKDVPLVYVGLGTEADYEGVDLKGKIALVSRGEITFGDKAKGAILAGAEAIIIFNNVPNESLNATFGEPLDIPGVGLTMEEGLRIKESINNDERTSALTGSVSILATDFGTISGTSMATPHVAGVAALVRAINPELNASEVKDILINSSIPSMNDNSENKYGNGIINARQAVETAKGFL